MQLLYNVDKASIFIDPENPKHTIGTQGTDRSQATFNLLGPGDELAGEPPKVIKVSAMERLLLCIYDTAAATHQFVRNRSYFQAVYHVPPADPDSDPMERCRHFNQFAHPDAHWNDIFDTVPSTEDVEYCIDQLDPQFCLPADQSLVKAFNSVLVFPM